MAEYNAPIPNVDPVEVQINDLFNRMVDCVNERRTEVLNKYRDLRDKPLARAKEEEELMKMREETERGLQLNKFRDLQEDMISKIDLKLAEIRKPQPDTRIVFRSESAPLEQMISQLGEVLEEVVIRVPNYQTMRPVVTVAKQGKAPGELYYPNAVATDSNNRIFVAEGRGSYHARISVFTERGEFLTTFTRLDMRCPCGLAIHGDYLYVADRDAHAIFQLKVETGFPLVTKQGTEGSQIGEFNDPNSLAVSTHGDVYVADSRNHRIQVLNMSLQHLRSLTQQPIRHPHDIQLTPDKVYVLCFGDPCILVFSHAGETLRSLVSKDPQKRVTDPYFFCLDGEENILISGYVDGQIGIFSKEGIHICTIGEEGEQPGQFLFLGGLVLTKELRLIVVSFSSNFSLQIFSCL